MHVHAFASLWLPVLVAAIAVFVASSLVHMVFKWHNSDYRKLANEDDVQATLRAGAPAPGQYTIPHCGDMKDMQSEAMKKKFRDGPVAFITISNCGPEPKMGPMLGQWFLLNLFVAAIAGMLAMQSVGPGGSAHAAGHLVGVVTLLAYGVGSISGGIWFARPWGSVGKDLLDALIYGGVSAVVFAWLWH